MQRTDKQEKFYRFRGNGLKVMKSKQKSLFLLCAKKWSQVSSFLEKEKSCEYLSSLKGKEIIIHCYLYIPMLLQSFSGNKSCSSYTCSGERRTMKGSCWDFSVRKSFLKLFTFFMKIKCFGRRKFISECYLAWKLGQFTALSWEQWKLQMWIISGSTIIRRTFDVMMTKKEKIKRQT